VIGTALEIDGPLLGRKAETELIAGLLEGIETGGGALVLRGEPGIGKSRLLAEAAARAHERGITMLSAAGVQSEAHLAFSGLHQLLRPVRDRAADLPPVHRAALDAAFGLGDGAPPEQFRIAMAALDLLSEVAMELEEAGGRARRRGATGVAFTALRRAAELSEPARRIPRLLAAAQLAFELGDPGAVAPLLQEVAQLAPDRLEQARATWIEEVVHPRLLADRARATALIAEAGRAGEAGDRELQLDLLWLVAQRAWWSDPGPDARAVLIHAADELGDLASSDPRVLAIQAYADPFGHAAAVLPRLQAATTDPRARTDGARYLGPAATVIGAFDVALTLLNSAVEGMRFEGRLGDLPRLLALRGTVAARLADWDVAITSADESRRLADELEEPMWAAGAETVRSLVAGMRGDEELAERAAAEAERTGLARGANFLLALGQFGRVQAALGASRHADAFEPSERLFDADDPAYDPVMATWLIADLAEAAFHLDRLGEGRARVAEVEAQAGDDPGVWIALGLRHARAMLAEGSDAAADRFAEALAADLGRWPFQRARLQLAHGQWLRRERRIAESRAPLRAARDAFDALGCSAWADQARRELRASGESSRRRADPSARDELTAQELQIAQLAADGLSNREIGQRLFVSHRTVGSHLYRIFPKLGITRRNELEGALAAGGGGAPPS
jgi:DNA-binding CsgD family transcriptional regulator